MIFFIPYLAQVDNVDRNQGEVVEVDVAKNYVHLGSTQAAREGGGWWNGVLLAPRARSVS